MINADAASRREFETISSYFAIDGILLLEGILLSPVTIDVCLSSHNCYNSDSDALELG